MDKNLFEQLETSRPIAADAIKEWVQELSTERKVQNDIAGKIGVASIDVVTGGLPRGVTELYGDAGSGKTMLLATIMAANQRKGKVVGLVPSEYFDAPYLTKLGVRLDETPLFRLVGRDLIDTTSHFVSRPHALLGIDSLTSLRPDLEGPGEWEAWACQYLDTLLSALGNESGVIVTSQMRSVRSKMPGRMFSGTDSAARHLIDRFSLRLELSREKVSERDYEMVVNVVYNVLQKPNRNIKVSVQKGIGIDIKRDFIDTALQLGVIKRQSSYKYYWFQGIRLGSSKEEVANKIFADDALYQKISSRL